ncbi:hypothetical protein E3N88_45302 [Mikania micrantha]|uniref:Uncharacterized protein n=1 Tax=Mikania micrantha TaxID=192012 RepID=A0A5N6L9K9_9ASTR|nr:hypothetical protein E3N88_45302 [Mikania micrantha]
MAAVQIRFGGGDTKQPQSRVVILLHSSHPTPIPKTRLFPNFEKITSRVQSKNNDHVRRYYYRLVRHMHKLLGPELSLDAKNSKDTNAAMLQWFLFYSILVV